MKNYHTQCNKQRMSKKLNEVLGTYDINRVVLAKTLEVDYKSLCSWAIGRTMPRSYALYERVMTDLNYLLDNVNTPAVFDAAKRGKIIMKPTVPVQEVLDLETEHIIVPDPIPDNVEQFLAQPAPEDIKRCGEQGTGLTISSSALDIQIGGSHYKHGSIQPIQYIEANGLGFLEGCMVKRLTRHDKPTGKGRQDIEKVIHECQLLLEMRYS